MKVAVIFYGCEPSLGGQYTFGEDIREAVRDMASKSRHEFVLYVTDARGDVPSDAMSVPNRMRNRFARAAVHQLRDILDQVGLPHRGPRTWLERSLAAQGIDIVWFATSYAERCDLPYLFTVFDIEHARQPWFPEVSMRGIWERRERFFSRYVRKATRVIVPNTAGRDQVVRHYRIDAERILCLGHPTPDFAREAARHAPLGRERVDRLGIDGAYLLYPAQFWAHKNHASLIDAVAALSREGTSYRLALVGSDRGGQLEHVRALTRQAGVAELVHFLGFVERDDLVALYQHAHALTYVSFFGPENLPPLEAFALGCPVIAADVPGAREQLGNGALFVPPTDEAQIAEAVRTLEDPNSRAELTTRGRDIAEGMSSQAYVRGVVGFLDEFESTRKCWP